MAKSENAARVLARYAGFRYIHVGYLGENLPATRPASRFEVAELFALPD